LPYEYRSMTPDEREAVMRERGERGYPWHAPPHPFRGPAQYLLTAANFEHNQIMASAGRRTEFETRLLQVMGAVGADLHGWVILANHYHALAGLRSLDLASAALKQLHGTTSRDWNMADGQTGRRRVWFKFSDRVIRGDAAFYQALNYVHFNPVKHGYVMDTYEWPSSSVHGYLAGHGRDWLRGAWKACPPGDFGRGWDD
jgi:putative transposase